jgi:leucyl-tRNA synthetase
MQYFPLNCGGRGRVLEERMKSLHEGFSELLRLCLDRQFVLCPTEYPRIEGVVLSGWCPVDKTVLANEQVEAGHCWRCGSVVEKKSMKQWFFKITNYADALLDEIEDLDWPQKIKTAQMNWIGRSVGAEISFVLEETSAARVSTGAEAPLEAQSEADSEGVKEITVFSTRPDTIFGATFLVLAPEHPLALELAVGQTKEATEAYIKEAVKKSEIFTLCASPPESVVAGCPISRYPRPTSISVCSLSETAGISLKNSKPFSTVIRSTS